jgi:alkylated DNA repair dioxygenase AlkB
MAMLFPLAIDDRPVPSISGLAYLPEYVTLAEEVDLVQQIDALPWDTTWERRRQLYGATYFPGEGAERPILEWGRALADRLHREGYSERPFDQLLVNEYEPGHGIALHHDHKPFDRTVVSLSLLSPLVMDFRNPATGERASMLLERRSLLVLSDDARYVWQHGIARRKNDRWGSIVIPRRRRLSVTLRLRRQVR